MQGTKTDKVLLAAVELSRTSNSTMQGIVITTSELLTAQVYNYQPSGEFQVTSYRKLLDTLNMLDSGDIDTNQLKPLRLITETGRDVFIIWNGPVFRNTMKDSLNLN